MFPEVDPTPAQRFGLRFKAAREAAGLTQAEAATKLGTTQPRVAEWETGVRVPKLLQLYEIIDALGLDDAQVLVRLKAERKQVSQS